MINLDHTPHPLVEDHYHIRHLIYSQEKRVQDRIYHKRRLELAYEHEEDIKKYPAICLLDFWCDKCKEDFTANTAKQTQDDWHGREIAFYKTKCWKGHWCIRHITDRLRDPYFIKSKKIIKDREKYNYDTLQPYEDGFNMVYGKPAYTNMVYGKADYTKYK